MILAIQDTAKNRQLENVHEFGSSMLLLGN